MNRYAVRVPKHPAFTIVELIVVISIIVLIIALLMPAIGKIRKQALEVNCGANLRSLGQALMMYVQQSGFYPGCMTDYGPGAAIWPTRLRPYTGGDTRVFNCPAQDEGFYWGAVLDGTTPVPADEIDAAWFGYTVGEPLIMVFGSYLTYGYNPAGTGGGSSSQRALGSYVSAYPVDRAKGFAVEVPSSRVKSPAEMIAIGDGTPDGIMDCMIGGGPFISPSAWPGVIHRGGANILFCDGHVTWYAQNDLVDFSGPPTVADGRRRIWHNDHEP